MVKGLIVANWKMHGSEDLLEEFKEMLHCSDVGGKQIDIVVCPPAVLVTRCAEISKGFPGWKIGAQDCHIYAGEGPYTGDISSSLLSAAGASHVILGHSERRRCHGETDAIVKSKIEAAWSDGLTVVLCVGEASDQYSAGKTIDVVLSQLGGSLPEVIRRDLLAVAYEPLWAIGTGNTPAPEMISKIADQIHYHFSALDGRLSALDGRRDSIQVLYGGSINMSNASAIFSIPGIQGGLIGRASLRASEFLGLIGVYSKVKEGALLD